MTSSQDHILKRIRAVLRLPPDTAVTVMEDGQNNLVYALDDRILRIPRHRQAERELVREARLLAVLGTRLPVPVPSLVLHEIDGSVVSVHRKIEGTVLRGVETLSAREREQLAGDLAGFLRSLHSLPTDMLRDLATPAPSNEWQTLLRRFETHVFPTIDAAAAARLREDFDSFLQICDALPRHIIHGDFGTGNILVDQDHRLAGVIDFAGCDIGDPAYDYASLAAGLGDAFTSLVLERCKPETDTRDRMAFYRALFPLLDRLDAAEHGG
jgi:aminoglycoside 2''-phosphotransferase